MFPFSNEELAEAIGHAKEMLCSGCSKTTEDMLRSHLDRLLSIQEDRARMIEIPSGL